MSVTFTVEDGTGISGANSYCTLQFADDYLSVKSNVDDWAALSDVTKQKYIMLATRLLDQRVRWTESTVQSDNEQDLAWPRMYAYDREQNQIPSDIVPDQVQDATVEVAFNLFTQQVDPSSPSDVSSSGVISKIKAGPIELDYAQGNAAVDRAFPKGLNYILRGLGTIASAGRKQSAPIVRV